MPAKYPQPTGVAASSYHHQQMLPSATWIIVHGLGYFPNATVADSTGRQVEGDVVYDSTNQLTISFAAGFAGDAYLS